MTAPALWRKAEYDALVSRFGSADNVSTSWVWPVVFNRSRAERSPALRPYAKLVRGTPAFGFGGTVPSQIGRFRIANAPVAIGLVGIEQALENVLSSDELEFVLAHEYSHILMNHSPYKYLGGYLSRALKARIARIDGKILKSLASLAWDSLAGSMSRKFTKESEIAADAHAAQLMGSIVVALRTVEKLMLQFAGGNPDLPCHYEVRNGRIVTILTYGERLDALSRPI
jgi:Zn-dependent protease with chaperone function